MFISTILTGCHIEHKLTLPIHNNISIRKEEIICKQNPKCDKADSIQLSLYMRLNAVSSTALAQ